MWSDKETLNDCLGYSSYVDVLADVCIRQELSPLTLGIFGAWGSGKTSLMAMLKNRLDGRESSSCQTLWFNAWKQEGRDEAQSALIHAILGKLTEGRTLAQEATDVLKRLINGASVLKLGKFITKSAVTLTPDLTGFLECFKDQSAEIAKTMHQFDRDFETLLEKVDISHIVVFIDDLDRCPSTKVIETFETIKLFLNTPRCTFVIGADVQRIRQAIGEVYGVTDDQRTKDYLEKIIQLPFNIPIQNPQDIACYIGMLIIGRHLSSNEGWTDFTKSRPTLYQSGRELREILGRWMTDNACHIDADRSAIEAELDGILPYVSILGDGLRGNPRQIKRFLNILALRRQLADANSLVTEDALLVKMTVLEYVWDGFFSALVETVDPASGSSPLLEELLSDEAAPDDDQSKLVAGFATKTRLLTFLRNLPALSADSDLRPYLFLAQTSISRGSEVRLLPPEEKAQSFAKSISSPDRVMSKAAALRSASEESDTVESVIRHLLTLLGNSKDNRVRTHILTGLDIICAKNHQFYGDVVKGLEKFDPGNNEAVGIAGNTLVTNAENRGIEVSSTLMEKFAKAAGVLSVLSGSKSGHHKGRRG